MVAQTVRGFKVVDQLKLVEVSDRFLRLCVANLPSASKRLNRSFPQRATRPLLWEAWTEPIARCTRCPSGTSIPVRGPRADVFYDAVTPSSGFDPAAPGPTPIPLEGVRPRQCKNPFQTRGDAGVWRPALRNERNANDR